MRVPVILGEIPLTCNPKGPSIRIMENQMEHDMETGDIYIYLYVYIYIYNIGVIGIQSAKSVDRY